MLNISTELDKIDIYDSMDNKSDEIDAINNSMVVITNYINIYVLF